MELVVLDGEASSEVHVDSGVPQGTVLGPLMFLLYVNAFIEVPPKECQNDNCFGGSLVNVVVPVEVIP
jgi:hypothetical protein